MQDDFIQFSEIIGIIKRHWRSVFIFMVAGAVLGLGASLVVPKKYKCKMVLNIQDSYFQIPLVGDVLGGSSDASEYRAQRESIMRYALNNEFLDKLGTKHHVFKYQPNDPMHILEREEFLKTIEYFPNDTRAYELSVTGRTSEDSFEILQAVSTQMVSTLMAERLDKLTRAKNAFGAHLSSLEPEISGSEVQRAGGSVDQNSLARAKAQLHSLEMRFTPNHPLVAQQRRKVALLAQGYNEYDFQAKSATTERPRAKDDLYADLLKKYNYLNIVIDMEKGTDRYPYVSIIESAEPPVFPTFPKKRMFGLAGLILGALLGFLRLGYIELRRGTFSAIAGPQTPVPTSSSSGPSRSMVTPSFESANLGSLIQNHRQGHAQGNPVE